MNHDDMDYRGLIPNSVQVEGTVLFVPFKQEPPSNASWESIASSVDGVRAEPKKWTVPAHVAFANLNLDNMADFASFVKTYGISGRFCSPSSFQQQVANKAKGMLLIYPENARRMQEFLRLMWGGEPGRVDAFEEYLETPKVESSTGDLVGFSEGVGVEIVRGNVRITAVDLDTLITFGYLIDRANNRVRVCEFPGCKRQRYFLKMRSDQEYCSSQCRALHNMEVWRSDPKNQEKERRRRRKKTKKSKRGAK